MVEDRITDGTRIAELLASELDGREDGPLDRVAVVNAREGVEPTEGGARAYDVTVDGTVVASALVSPERAHLAFPGRDAVADGEATIGAAASAARSAGLRPPREGTGSSGPPGAALRVPVESGAEVKGAVEVVSAVAAALPDGP